MLNSVDEILLSITFDTVRDASCWGMSRHELLLLLYITLELKLHNPNMRRLGNICIHDIEVNMFCSRHRYTA